jgi:transposase
LYILFVMSAMHTEVELTTPEPHETAPQTLQDKPLSDLESVRDYVMGLLQSGKADQAIDILLSLVARMTEAHNAVSVRLQQALRQLYGKKRERFVSPDQLAFFFGQLLQPSKTDAQPAAAPTPAPAADNDNNNKPPKTKKLRGPQPPRGAAALPAHLERRVTRVEPPASESVCAICNTNKEIINIHVSERLEFEPAKFFVHREERPVVSCPKCRTGVASAPASETALPGGLPGPSLLAQVVTAKYKDGLPLYRQEKIYEKRYAVPIAISTLSNWVGAVGDLLEPLAKLLKERTLKNFILHVDDTGIHVLDRDDPRGIIKGHLWPYVGQDGNVFVEYTPTWSGLGPQSILGNRVGPVVCDGYAGYGPLFELPSPRIEVGCWMHARRGFEKAYKAGDPRGAVILELVQKLYAVEREANKDGVDHRERLKRRQQYSAPVVNDIFRLLDDWVTVVAPKTPLGKAIGYARNRQVQLSRFLQDGRIPLDNGKVERLIRLIAVGRKNWLFIGSDAAAKRAANIFSAILSCELIGIDPWAYLKDVLPKLASCSFPHSRLSELLPEEWNKRQTHADR